MFRLRAIVVALLLALLLAGCGTQGQGATTSAPAPNTSVRQQTVGGLTIALEAPAAPALLDQASFLITLTDAGGKPVNGADVYIDMTMATMKMGTNKPVASAAGNGTYRAQGTFDMAGDWTITVHATVAGKEHAATFDSQVAEQ
ncbi:MAG: FixH family protein [Chloroflexales bacterium]|nr:FixH family protein [Chloroflexales bacterium]